MNMNVFVECENLTSRGLALEMGVSLRELKDGKNLLRLLERGLTPVQIDYLLDIRPSTIEQRVIDFLNSKESSYNEFKFIFENVKGLPKVDIAKLYLDSMLEDSYEFCKSEGINKERFKKILIFFEEIEYFKHELAKKREYLAQEKRIYANSTLKRMPISVEDEVARIVMCRRY